MAINKVGIFGEVSGKVGGVEFARHRGQSVIKQAKSRGARHTPERMRVQQQQAAALAHWRGLTNDQRRAWELAARQKPRPDRFGVMRNLSGVQAFLTIPHDFRGEVTELWQDDPPVGQLYLTETPAAYITDAPFLGLALTILGPVDAADCVSIWTAQYQSGTGANWRNFRKIGMTTYANQGPCNLGVWFQTYPWVFQVGEEVRVWASFWKQGYWPCWYDFGSVVVDAQ